MSSKVKYTKKYSMEPTQVCFHDEENLSEDLTSEDVSSSGVKTTINLNRNMSNTPFNSKTTPSNKKLENFAFFADKVKEYESQKNVAQIRLNETNTRSMGFKNLPVDTTSTNNKMAVVSQANQLKDSEHEMRESSTKNTLRGDISRLLQEAMKKRSKSETLGKE
mmetsp:Transcript_29037/g.25681  ORF Transcript_29037/g.25681 Transcript_29037/m.25681 type:complete len:164 (+) Transcript_29037:15-506(+)